MTSSALDPITSVDLHLQTADGLRLAARRWEPATVDDPTVVVAHGFTGHQGHPAVLEVVEALRATGAGVLTFDARGHGQSEGCCTLGREEPLDIEAAVVHARSHADRVAVVATSMGAIAALRQAATVGHPDGLVTVSCPARWRIHSARAAAAAMLTRTAAGRWFMAKVPHVRVAKDCGAGEEPVVTATRVRCPTAVIHGLRDPFISPREATLLHDALQVPATLDLLAGMRHAFELLANPAIVRDLAWVLDPRRVSSAAAPGPGGD